MPSPLRAEGAVLAKSDRRNSTDRGHPGVAEDPPVPVWTKGRLPARGRGPRREVLSRRREAVLRVRDRELDRGRWILTGLPGPHPCSTSYPLLIIYTTSLWAAMLAWK